MLTRNKSRLLAFVLVVVLGGFFCLVAAPASRAGAWPNARRGWGGNTSHGVVVQSVQYLLRARGFPIAVDSSFGLQTQQQVRAFQRANGLPPSGVVTDATWRKLIIPVRRGSRGDAVYAVQCQIYQALPDGIFNADMEDWVRHCQKKYHLYVDGIVGLATWRAILNDPDADEG